MYPVDLDKIVTWPSEVKAFLAAHSDELRTERREDHRYSLSPSTYRFMNDAPPMPRWDEAKSVIQLAMSGLELVAFHATRLIDFDQVRDCGLRMLDLKRHVERLKSQLQKAGAVEALSEVDTAVTKMCEAHSSFSKREGAVWATPLRASLHDGGCNVFYESYGGEALQRIADLADGELKRALKRLGMPAVVIIRYPAHGWCARTQDRLPQSMMELYLQHEGNWQAMDCGWDSKITVDVPPENIVAVVHPDDPLVTA